MALTQEFFAAESLGQLSVAVAAVTAVSVTIRRVSGLNSPILPFVVSVIVTYVAAGAAGSLKPLPLAQFPAGEFFRSLIEWLVPLLNSCLLFSSVIGVTEMAGTLDGHKKHQRLIDEIRKLPPQDPAKVMNFEHGQVPDKGRIDQYIRLSSWRIKNRLFRSWFEEPGNLQKS